MCVLAAVPPKLNTAYHARVQDSLATDLSVSILWLKAINLNIKPTKDMLR
jgi:hypothetical protein